MIYRFGSLRVRRATTASCARTGAPWRSSRSRRRRSRCCCRRAARSSVAKSCAMRSGARTRTSISIADSPTASRRFAPLSATVATTRVSCRPSPSADSSSSPRSPAAPRRRRRRSLPIRAGAADQFRRGRSPRWFDAGHRRASSRWSRSSALMRLPRRDQRRCRSVQTGARRRLDLRQRNRSGRARSPGGGPVRSRRRTSRRSSIAIASPSSATATSCASRATSAT